MDDTRADRALARIDAALARIATARKSSPSKQSDPAANAQIMKLVNTHEKLREEVSEALGELDAVLDELESGGV